MNCPHCGHVNGDGASFCTNCGTRLNEGTARPASDSNGIPVPINEPAAESPVPTCEPITEASPELPVDAAPNPVDSGPAAGTHQPDTAAPAAEPVPALKKPRGKLVPRIAAVVAAVAIGGILLVNVLIPLISPKPWCIGTWYCAGVTTFGIENLHFSDETKATLVIEADGTAKLHLGGSDEYSDWTGSWKENEHDGKDLHTAELRLKSDKNTALFIRYTLICSNPNDKQSLACLIADVDTDMVLALCRDKQAAQSSPWSRSDLPSLDSSSPSSSSRSSDSSSSREHSSSRSGERSSSSSATLGQSNALESAQAYLDNVGGFSESGLRDQLEYEGFSSSEIDYAIEHCGANWNEQCAECAQDYLDSMSMSRSELYDQLEYEGFTSSQIAYGLAAVGY